MRLHENFEWDEAKAEKNLKKHRVSFGDAALVLADDEAARPTSKSSIRRTAMSKSDT